MTFDIRAGVARLARRALLDPNKGGLALKAAVLQFNEYLNAAKARYPESIDIRALPTFSDPTGTWQNLLHDAIDRLADGLDAVVDDLLGDSPMLSSKFGILRAESQLEADFSAYATEPRALGLLFFDIDHFKALNTKYTETIVDETILAPFQHFLLDLLHLRGFAYSVGGDEFIALLRNVDSVEAAAFGERLLRATAARTFAVESDTVTLTLSIGVACYPHDAQSLFDLRRLANAAENMAKAAGRNRVVRTSQPEAACLTTDSTGLATLGG